jgi:hypothetical protein
MLLGRLKSWFSWHRLDGIHAQDTAGWFNRRWPGFIEQGDYRLPHRCTGWLLVQGPSLGTARHRATLLVQSISIRDWASRHALSVWSSSEIEQAARHYLPKWLETSDPTDDSVTVPDPAMLAVLQPYADDFMTEACIRYWCPDCRVLYQNVYPELPVSDWLTRKTSWGTRWRCPLGHVGCDPAHGSSGYQLI